MFNSQKIDIADDGYSFEARPGFANEPNRMLLAFRGAVWHSVTDSSVGEIAAAWLEESWPKAISVAERGHARRVLERLAAL